MAKKKTANSAGSKPPTKKSVKRKPSKQEVQEQSEEALRRYRKKFPGERAFDKASTKPPDGFIDPHSLGKLTCAEIQRELVAMHLRPEQIKEVLDLFLHPDLPDEFDIGHEAFQPRPGIAPYTAFDTELELAGDHDWEQMHKTFNQEGFNVASLQQAWLRGYAYTFVQQRMFQLGTIVYVGGKEIEDGSLEGDTISWFMQPFGIAAALLGLSGVAGGGFGAMMMGQRGHGAGIQAVKRAGWKSARLFKKCGVCAILLAIAQESPNDYVTPQWTVKPTRNLWIRKGRLFRVGVPLLVVCFEGGDATLDEWLFWKTMIKQILVDQLDTPFPNHQPNALMIDKVVARRKKAFWEHYMEFYGDQMVTGSESRRQRKQAEVDELKKCISTVKIGDRDSALAACLRGFELLEPNAKKVYGAPLITTWEARTGANFWDTVDAIWHQSADFVAPGA